MMHNLMIHGNAKSYPSYPLHEIAHSQGRHHSTHGSSVSQSFNNIGQLTLFPLTPEAVPVFRCFWPARHESPPWPSLSSGARVRLVARAVTGPATRRLTRAPVLIGSGGAPARSPATGTARTAASQGRSAGG